MLKKAEMTVILSDGKNLGSVTLGSVAQLIIDLL